jgi:release factor glutamine methyltransferase
MSVLECVPHLVAQRRVCEIGTGSGAIALFAARLGAQEIIATETEGDALAQATARAFSLEYGDRITFRQGSLWVPLEGERFDLVLANLPHFPAQVLHLPGRLPSWGAGGDDGRRLLDPFLAGLKAHLTPGGYALLTHNHFVDLDLSAKILARDGLQHRSLAETLVYLSPAKVQALSPKAYASPGILTMGDQVFGRVCILAVGRDLKGLCPC